MPTIENIPTCAICQSDVEVPHLAAITSCNHTFHQNCYLHAYETRTSDPFSCPCCRQPHSFMIPSEDGTMRTIHFPVPVTAPVPAQQYVSPQPRPPRVRPVVDPAHRCTGTYKNGNPCQRRRSALHPDALLCGPCIGRQLSAETDSIHGVIQAQNKASGSIVSYKRKAEDRLSKEMDKTVKIEHDMQEALRLQSDNQRRAATVSNKFRNVQQMLQTIISTSQLPQLPPAPIVGSLGSQQSLLALPAPDQSEG